jgi:lipid-A-disaccharide synthase
MTRIGLSACEPSADMLAGALINALRARDAGARVCGLGGTEFAAAGGVMLEPAGDTAVMGLVEVAMHLPRLLALRARLGRHFLRQRPDVFVGVDAPDFNLGLELQLRRAGIPTVQYVGPSVWAWRSYRLPKIARACDRVLVLFPFEKRFYDAAGVPCTFVGHPLADSIPLEPDRAGARARLGLAPDAVVIALLPGSRRAELSAHVRVFLETAGLLAQRLPGVRFVASLVNQQGADAVRTVAQALGPGATMPELHLRRTQDVLMAADVAIVASGTATLEAMLCKTPMVVAYRMNPLSYRVIRSLVRVDHAALPNLLCGRAVVPELLQDDCRAQDLAAAALHWLEDASAAQSLRAEFMAQHVALRCAAAQRAADAVLDVARGA